MDQQIQYYMDKLGVLDPTMACDPDWAEDHVKAIRSICMGQSKPLDSDSNSGGIRGKLAKMTKE